MTGIVVFVLVLAAVFAIKAVSIVKTSDELASMGAMFSMVRPTAADAQVPAEEQVGAPLKTQSAPSVPVRAYGHRHASAA